VQYTLKEPIGVAGLISPWNLPLYLLSFKVAPAMAAGNTVVAKPSEMTSVTAFKLCEIIKEAGEFHSPYTLLYAKQLPVCKNHST
jgi:acyl-CoA reductase-like NAD-dependent aldehyde dehydrogenase